MVTRLANLLLRKAAARWPADVRGDLHREWLAEMHVLAQQNRPIRTLAFASSLLFARPAHTRKVALDRRLWNTTLHLIGGPALITVMMVVPLLIYAIGYGAVVGFLNGLNGTNTDGFSEYMVLIGWVFWLAELWLLARIGGRWGRRSVFNGPILVTLALIVTLPLAPLLMANRGMDSMLGGISVLLPGLALVLYLVGKLANAGRVRAAWLVGIATWLLVLELATVVHFQPPSDVSYWTAPLWLLVAAVDQPIAGVPHMPLAESLLGMPQMWLFLAIFGMSYVIGAVRPIAESESAPSLAGAHR